MEFIYGGEKPKKHVSPTKRLMQQKEAAWTHKTHMKNNLASNDDYKLTYIIDPKKSYVIQPKEGEIDYSMADKKPMKFYETVMKQKVTEHKVQRASTFVGRPDSPDKLPKKRVLKKGKTLEIKSRTTIRAVCRILRAVQNKMERLIADHCDDEVTPAELKRAMSHPDTQEVLQKHVKKGNVKLLHKDSFEPVFEKQMSEIAQKGIQAAQKERHNDDIDETLDHDPDDAILEATDEALKEVGTTVNMLKRTNSLTK